MDRHLACINRSLFTGSVCPVRRLCAVVCTASFAILLLTSHWSSTVSCSAENNDGALAVRHPTQLRAKAAARNHVLYVVSLDGTITAIDARQGGRQIWVANTGAALIDSTLSKFEMVRDAKAVRLVPSLIGGLYGKHEHTEHLEALPFDAECLLNTSFHFHDELAMSGGKAIDTLAINLHTGRIVYEFSDQDAEQSRARTEVCTAPMLLVKRTKQTVRARSVRNGHEKWNFSVSNYELLQMHAPTPEEIPQSVENHRKSPAFFEYQLQSGVVLAFDHSGQLLWTSFIDRPIAAVWELKGDRLKEKSLFKTKSPNRLAFLGNFNSTPYVIISPHAQRQLIHHARQIARSASNVHRPMLQPWSQNDQGNLLTVNHESATSEPKYPLIVRQSSVLDIKGYLQLTHPMDHIVEEEPADPGSRFYWFFVPLLLLLISAFWYSRRKQQPITPEPVVILPESLPQPPPSPQAAFQSRYTLEYEHVRFLGRGGFGIVFEAVNKLDQRRVAVKRVSLKKSSNKERALREIRCMAILNHPNLIQYYYAWNECPPNDWQDEEGQQNEATRDSLSILSSEPTNRSQPVRLPAMIDFTFERSLNASQVVSAAKDNDETGDSSLFEHSDASESDEDADESATVATNPSGEAEKPEMPTTYFYFVMELCQLASLRDRLLKGPIRALEAWTIFDQIVQGIEYIHSQKLIHRDLKPANILFSMENVVRIGDFGLVSAFGENKAQPKDDDELSGTMLYMSPEQINRQSFNQKVDIYAMGIILFELLHPFATQMERINVLTNVRSLVPMFPAGFEANLPTGRLVRWLLSPSPSDRPKACDLREDRAYQDILTGESFL